MPTYKRQTMCDECPFRATAPAGWLGPYTVQQMHDIVHKEGDLICHKDVARLAKKGASKRKVEVAGQHCVGMLRYRSSVCKRGHDATQLAAQDALEVVPDQPTIPPFQFDNYHGNKIGQP